MQLRSEAATADMYARKAEGATIEQIAAIWNLSPAAVYKRLNRSYGAGIPRSVPQAANDNNPDRVTRMTPHNGGCSTTSGKMPVSVRRTSADAAVEGDGGYRGIDPIKNAGGIETIVAPLQVAA